MNKVIYLITAVLLVLGCSSVKQVEKNLNSGNYDQAIAISIKKIRKNKTSKTAKKHIILLQKTFEKAVKRDKDQITFLTKDNNPENLQSIFNLYNDLTARQELIKPLLPLRLSNGNKAEFKIENYQDQLIATKGKLVSHLYDKSVRTLNRNPSKIEIREVYDHLKNIDNLNPNYKNVRDLMQESHYKGTDFVLVSINNKTEQVIPKRLENDLLQFDSYKLNDFWTIYHSKKDYGTNYDYLLNLNFSSIKISPERVKERDFIKEKTIKETIYVKDSTGKKIKSFRSKKVKSHFYEVKQLKTCDIAANVEYLDYKTKQRIESFPLQSGFVFEHFYGTQRGDRRALEDFLIEMLSSREIPFPTNEQMVYDAGQDLKQKLKQIILNNKF